MLQSLHRSAWRQAPALCLNKFSIHRILNKDIHYHPHKIQVAQELSEWDKVGQLQFCNEFLGLLQNNSKIANTLLMSYKAHFHTYAYVNKQNCCYWPSNNTHELHQHPLHTAKVSVWCAVSSHGITGPYCFEKAEGPTGVLLNCWATARYWALASIIPGHERFSWNLSF